MLTEALQFGNKKTLFLKGDFAMRKYFSVSNLVSKPKNTGNYSGSTLIFET
jgi:hypothetical protein